MAGRITTKPPAHSVAAVLLIVVLLLALQLVSMPRSTLWMRTLLDSSHFGVFAVISLAALALVQVPPIRARHLLGAFGLTAMLAIVSEAAQIPIRRDASLNDVLTNWSGAAAALLLMGAVKLRLSARRRLALAVAAALLATLSLWPLISVSHAYVVRNAQFPVIVAFEDDSERHFLRIVGTPLERQPNGAGEFCGRLRSGDAGRLSLGVVELEPDWRGYSALRLRLQNESERHIELVLRVHDRAHEEGEQPHSDRFNETIDARPGLSTVTISLDRIRQAPANRSMNLANMSRLALFTNGTAGPVCIDRIWLE